MTDFNRQDLHAWLSWMESLHPNEIDMGLARIRQVADSLELCSLPCKVVSVAGTNGKGSFVKALSSLLIEEGRRVACYTSPHINFYNERIAIDGEFVSDEQICLAFDAIDKARLDISLTYFEFGTLAALYLFKQAELDVCILEVGLGGRLDAVNIVDADISVITSIGVDHEAWLGSDRKQIALEKAGILRQNRPFISVEADLPETASSYADELQCASYLLGSELAVEAQGQAAILNYQAQTGSASLFLAESSLPLPSLLAALQCYHLLASDSQKKILSDAQVASVLSRCRLSGRYEQISYSGCEFIFDVAHNPQAASLLADKIKQREERLPVCLFTAMSDKDIAGIVAPLSETCANWICTELLDVPRCLSAVELEQCLLKLDVETQLEPSPMQALHVAMSQALKKKTKVLVLGSFFIVAEIKKLMAEYPNGLNGNHQ
ncbi:folylpolyglutamate synthase/dihydrofolate synthase family protein [Agaribacterium sp. ZY112]|uniref:bifunctional folylpolyglutamate synthase/dihydrofolate synthase n=1 Tax=Agaribacterium sp. ZY112 TaxID=3233574 RepID=UPI0035247519